MNIRKINKKILPYATISLVSMLIWLISYRPDSVAALPLFIGATLATGSTLIANIIVIALLALGMIGYYCLINSFQAENKDKFIAALGAILLNLNILTLQTWFVADQEAILLSVISPWILLSTVNYLRTGQLKWLSYLLVLILGLVITSTVSTSWITVSLLILVGLLVVNSELRHKISLVLFSLPAVIGLFVLNPTEILGNWLTGSQLNLFGNEPNLLAVVTAIPESIANTWQTSWTGYLELLTVSIIYLAIAILAMTLTAWRLRSLRKTLIIKLTIITILIGGVWIGFPTIRTALTSIFLAGVALLLSTIDIKNIKLLQAKTGRMIMGVSMIALFFLLNIPLFQTGLTPEISSWSSDAGIQEIVREISTSDNHTTVFVVSDNISQSPNLLEYQPNILPILNAGLEQKLITIADAELAQIYWQLLATTNTQDQLQLIEQFNIQWLILDLNDPSYLSPAQRNQIVDSQLWQEVELTTTGIKLYKSQLAATQPLSLVRNLAKQKSSTYESIVALRSDNSVSLTYPLAVENIIQIFPGQVLSELQNGENKLLTYPPAQYLTDFAIKLDITPLNLNKSKFTLKLDTPQINRDNSSNSQLGVTVMEFEQKLPNQNFILVLNDDMIGPFTPKVSHSVNLPTLNVLRENSVRIYSQYDNTNVTQLVSFSKFRDCDTQKILPSKNKTVSVDRTNIRLNTTGCLLTDTPFIETNGSVLLQTQFELENNVPVEVCYLDRNNDCIVPAEKIPASSTGQTIEFKSEIGKVLPSELKLRIEVSQDINREKPIVQFSKIRVKEYELIEKLQTYSQNWYQEYSESIPGNQSSLTTSAQTFTLSLSDWQSCNQGTTVETNPSSMLANNQTKSICISQELPLNTNTIETVQIDFLNQEEQQVDICVYDQILRHCIPIEVKQTQDRLLIQYPRYADAILRLQSTQTLEITNTVGASLSYTFARKVKLTDTAFLNRPQSAERVVFSNSSLNQKELEITQNQLEAGYDTLVLSPTWALQTNYVLLKDSQVIPITQTNTLGSAWEIDMPGHYSLVNIDQIQDIAISGTILFASLLTLSIAVINALRFRVSKSKTD